MDQFGCSNYGSSSPLSSIPSSLPASPSFNVLNPLLSPSPSRFSDDRVSPVPMLRLQTSIKCATLPPRSGSSTPKRKLTRSSTAPVISTRTVQETISLPQSPTLSLSTSTTQPEAAPATKRRRVSEPASARVRKTRHLDLTGEMTLEEQQQQVDYLLNVLRKKRKIVVIAGAGISVSAGIPDFRSSTGLFQTLRAQYNLKSSGRDLFDASVYKQKASITSFHHMVREMSTQVKQAKPTPFHHMLASLANEGRLLRLYTQNIDSIDSGMEPLATKIPLRAPWPKTIQLHGSLEKSVCIKCHTLYDFDANLFCEAAPPACAKCQAYDFTRTTIAGKRSHGVGHLRPRMVLYNETGPDELSIGAVSTADLRTRPDALIVVGTTLKVPGTRRLAKEMASVVQGRRDGVTVWINYDREPTASGLDKCWDLVVKGACDKVAELVGMSKWDSPPVPIDSTESTEKGSDVESSTGDDEKDDPVKTEPGQRASVRQILTITPPSSQDGQLITPGASPVGIEPHTDKGSEAGSVVPDTKPTKPARGKGAGKGRKAGSTTSASDTTKPRKPRGAPKKKGVDPKVAKITLSFGVSKGAAPVQLIQDGKPGDVEVKEELAVDTTAVGSVSQPLTA